MILAKRIMSLVKTFFFLAVAASETSQDSVCFIRIDSEEQEALELLTDNYGHCISSGQKYVAGKYLEKLGPKNNVRHVN